LQATRKRDALQELVDSYRRPLGMKGVQMDNGRWAARIAIKGKRYWLGRFDTPEEAQAARDHFMVEMEARVA
jgi:hypothetical protein